jgi:hypothetical protein
VSLVAELKRIAVNSGASLGDLYRGNDRFGPVDAILPTAGGRVTVRPGTDSDYELAIWVRDEIVAAGRTSSLASLVRTMIGRQEGASFEELCQRHDYLQVVDSERAREMLWLLLAEQGEEHIRAAVSIVGARPALRQLRPWVSHGTLHLLHPQDRVDSARYGLVFHPAADDLFQLRVYGHSPATAEPLNSAAARAEAAVKSWRLKVDGLG